MLIISRVCAEFRDAKGTAVFAVTPSMINRTFIEAPEFIREDPLFNMLISDGSLEASISKERQRELENDPVAGHDATGKAIDPTASETEPSGSPSERNSGIDPSAHETEPSGKSSGRSSRSPKEKKNPFRIRKTPLPFP